MSVDNQLHDAWTRAGRPVSQPAQHTVASRPHTLRRCVVSGSATSAPFRWFVAVLVVTLCTLGWAAWSAQPALAVGQYPDYAPPQVNLTTPCPAIAVVGERGSGEKFTDANVGLGGPIAAMVAELRRELPGTRIGTSAVNYPAVPWLVSFGASSIWSIYASIGWTAKAVASNILDYRYADSVATGAEDGASDLTHLAVRCPGTKIIAAGYSQGAEALRGTLNQVSSTTASHIAAVRS